MIQAEGLAGHGHRRDVGSLRQGLFASRQEEKVPDEGSTEVVESGFQRNICLQGRFI